MLGSQWAFGSVCCGRWWQHDSGAGCGCAQVSGWRSVGGGGGGHASREPRAPWAGRVARVLPRALSSGGPLACVGEGAAATAHAFSGRGRSAEWLGKFFERVCNKRRKFLYHNSFGRNLIRGGSDAAARAQGREGCEGGGEMKGETRGRGEPRGARGVKPRDEES